MIKKDYDINHLEENTCWIVELSNGETIYQYDLDNVSSWIELKKYIYEENLEIKKMYLRFRSNILYPLEENAEGYFFSVGIIGIMTLKNNINFYLLGTVKNNNVRIQKIKIPELIVFEEEDRSLDLCKPAQLIMNGKTDNGKRKI